VSQQKARLNRDFDQNYTDAFLKVTAEHTVVQNLALLRFMNGQVRSSKLETWTGPEDSSRAEALMRPFEGCHVVAVCPGASHPGKIFPAELLLQILRELPSSYRFVLLGDREDRAQAHLIRDKLGDRASMLCGETTLREALAILQRCRAAIAMDSALVHLAAAAETPVVLFSMHPRSGNDCLEQSPLRFGPWCDAERRLIIQPNRAWPGCETGCRFRDSRPHCIANIDIEPAGAVIRSFLARFD
jgi:ADP-heptose:LPS heptosyltransferase